MNLMLETFDDLKNKIIILGGNFNLFLDFVLEAEGGSPIFKKIFSFKTHVEIKEKYNLCDIWRIRNTKEKPFTFRKKHRSGFLERLDYFFVSNTLQESIKDTEILPALTSDL